MKVLIQTWCEGRLVEEFDYDSEVNQMETIEGFFNDIHALEVGDGFTYIVQRVD